MLHVPAISRDNNKGNSSRAAAAARATATAAAAARTTAPLVDMITLVCSSDINERDSSKM